MSSGIDLTFQVLAQSKNKAVLKLLGTAFHSSSELVRKIAGTFLITYRGGSSISEIIRDFDPSDSFIVELINTNRNRILPGLRSAIVGPEPLLSRNAFRIAYTQQFYEIIPTLLAFCFGPSNKEKPNLVLTDGLIKFFDKYIQALERHDPAERHILFGQVLPEIIKVLRQKVKEFRQDSDQLTLKIFLRVCPYFTDTESDLKQVLRLSTHPIYLATYRLLFGESQEYLFRFVFLSLDHVHPSPIVSQVVAKRSDISFLSYLFKRIQEPMSLELKTNIAKLPPIEWIGQVAAMLDQLVGEEQRGLVLMIHHLSIPAADRITNLMRVYRYGRDVGRLAAFRVLATFSGDMIEQLIWDASDDADPAIQVEALNLLAQRNDPGMNSRIIQFASSPYDAVRETVQRIFPDFRLTRFMELYDHLPEGQRQQMFHVVRKLDKKAPEEISKILTIGKPTAKAKALRCLDYCNDIIPLVEDALCDVLMKGDSPLLRSKAAEFLALGKRELSRSTLVQAFHRDASPEVRAAVKTSLEKRPTYWGQSEPPTM